MILHALGLVGLLLALGGVHFWAAANRPDEALFCAVVALGGLALFYRRPTDG